VLYPKCGSPRVPLKADRVHHAQLFHAPPFMTRYSPACGVPALNARWGHRDYRWPPHIQSGRGRAPYGASGAISDGYTARKRVWNWALVTLRISGAVTHPPVFARSTITLYA